MVAEVCVADHFGSKRRCWDWKGAVALLATAGADHALRIETDPKDKTPSPYIHIRARLEALISRAVFYDLVALGETLDDQFGVWSENVFFPIASASDVEAWLEDGV